MKERNLETKLLIVFLMVILVIVIIYSVASNKLVFDNKSDIYITEVMVKNKSVIKDMDGKYSDYIEIYNDTSDEINLDGYYLSDEVISEKKWMFPEVIIKPYEYLVVFASGKDNCNLNTRECHTNFKLSSNGETISLLDNSGKVISKVKYSEIDTENMSYSLINNQYKLTVGTPYTYNKDILVDNNMGVDVIISEVSTTNPEVVELRNITDKDINLSNYYIKDKSNSIYEFEDATIKANSYLVLYGSDTKGSVNNQIHLGFRINNSNEILYLYKNHQLIDTFNVGRMTDGISKGRNNKMDMVVYKNKTIGSKNSETEYLGFSLVPSFSLDGGYVDKGVKVKLSSNDGSTIYYTLDGTIPSDKSKKYDGEITINKDTVIKAITYRDGYIESDIESRTYLIGREHDLPVISISTDNSYLYGSNGIFTTGVGASSYYPYYGANFWKDIEVPITFEFYEDGELALNFNCGMKVFGGWSRGEAQKSVAIHLRKKYGLQEITYPFFEDNVNTFSKFILRSSGQDFGKLKIKDAFLQEVLDGQMDIDKQDYRPVVVYFNGKYYGIYNIREKVDASYVYRHYGYENNEIDFIERNNDVLAGTIMEYNKLLEYVKTHDMTKNDVYEYVSSQVDIQELINYWVVETYYGQFDPINIKFYKPFDGKWRWILFDLDQSFLSWSYQTINWDLPFKPYAHGNNYYLDTTLMSNLYKNPEFRLLYVETFAYHLNNTFKPDRMNKILDSMVDEIKTEMPYHIDRWYSESIRVSSYTLDNINEWYNNIDYFKRQINTKYNIARKTIKEGLGLTDEEYKKYFKD